MSTPFGFEAAAYRFTSARTVIGSGTLPGNTTLVNNIRDCTVTASSNKGDVSKRGLPWKRTKPGMHDVKAEFEMLWDTNDADFTAMKNAYINRTTIPMVFLDGVPGAVGTQGYSADWSVTEFSRPEPLDNPLLCKVVLEIGPDVNTAVPPEYCTVTT